MYKFRNGYKIPFQTRPLSKPIEMVEWETNYIRRNGKKAFCWRMIVPPKRNKKFQFNTHYRTKFNYYRMVVRQQQQQQNSFPPAEKKKLLTDYRRKKENTMRAHTHKNQRINFESKTVIEILLLIVSTDWWMASILNEGPSAFFPLPFPCGKSW